MRRALVKRLPALSRYFGLHPWDVERLTLREVAEYVRALDRIAQAEAERAQQ